MERGNMDRRIPERRSTSVLVVDDEWLIRAALVDQLEEDGFEVFEAENTAEALRILDAHHQIGSVVTDIQMPGSVDGLAFARFIRDSFPPIRLIVSSGAIRPSAAELPRDTVFLQKPLIVRELSPLLRSHD
jgi:two-component system, response regulator PdtaR